MGSMPQNPIVFDESDKLCYTDNIESKATLYATDLTGLKVSVPLRANSFKLVFNK